MNITADVPLKLNKPVDATDLTEAVKEYTIPSRQTADGISVPISPVTLVDATQDPIRQYSAFNWDSIPVKRITMTQPALGADFAVAETTVPAGKKWLFVSAYIIIGTSGVANWYATCQVDDGTTGHNMWHDEGIITAATPTNIHIGNYGFRQVTTAWQWMPSFPQIEMPAGYIFRVTGATADDRWGTSYFFYKEAPA